MDENNENKLLIYIKAWFEKINLSDPNIWNRNLVAKLIKTNLTNSGNFRKKAKTSQRKKYKAEKSKNEW